MPEFPMPLLAVLALALALAQDRTETLGKSHAQILAMGRTRWRDAFVGKFGGSTAGEAGAESLYGDALAWRNDRLLKGRKSPLRDRLQAFKNDAVGVGEAITGGGTMWNIIAASFYADAEETFYRVLTHTGRAPKRVVSDVDKGLGRLGRALAAVGDPKYRKQGAESMADLQKEFRALVAAARRLPRRDSDTVLEFCRKTLEAIDE